MLIGTRLSCLTDRERLPKEVAVCASQLVHRARLAATAGNLGPNQVWAGRFLVATT
jgi:hypothetical protein